MTDLQPVKRAAAKAAASREKLEREIRAAHADGATLRAIAEAAKMSHESVRRIVATAD